MPCSSGAIDYLFKPLEQGKFLDGIERALELYRRNREARCPGLALQDERQPRRDDFAYIVTRNSFMLEQLRYLQAVAPSRQPVLIQGETGVGKELFARALHQASMRSGPFVAVNAAGIDDIMFSDTLFGHKKGTYTGAAEARQGLVARAEQGSLFLDEIGDLGEASQVKLLRLIQEQEYYPLGSDTPCKSSSRLILATNRDLKESVQKGRFRQDLYYRLFAHQISIPPLRKRLDDIPLLLDSFIASAARAFAKSVPCFPKELCTLLSTHPFPGNVRELQAMVLEAVARNSSRILKLEPFQEIMQRDKESRGCLEAEPGHAPHAPQAVSFTIFPTLKEAEKVLIDKALDLARSNQGIAASMLGISRQALNRRLQTMDN